jgi:hypothetical protein
MVESTTTTRKKKLNRRKLESSDDEAEHLPAVGESGASPNDFNDAASDEFSKMSNGEIKAQL